MTTSRSRAPRSSRSGIPYTLPIITEQDGQVEYLDLIEGITLVERMDEVTGLTTKVVVDYKQGSKTVDLRPRLQLKDARGDVVRLSNGNDARYFLAPDSILSVENGAQVAAGDVLARIPREGSKTRDITGGLPRVAELFEARRPKDHAVIAENDGRVEFGKDYKAKRRVIVKNDETGEETEYLIPKGKHVSVQEGDFVRRGDPLVDGPRVPHDILKVLGVEALSDYLVNEIQEVYRLQGVKINDKHIEVIVRQMLQKVEILDPGDTTFLIGEQVDRVEYEKEIAKLGKDDRPAVVMPVLQGITKASLQTSSFISAASFQETTRVLTEAATAGKTDYADGPEGERDRRASDPGRHGFRHEPSARDCGGAGSARAARAGAGESGGVKPAFQKTPLPQGRGVYSCRISEPRAETNSSTAPASRSHSASPIGSISAIMPRRASQFPAASMSKKNRSFSFALPLAASAGERIGPPTMCTAIIEPIPVNCIGTPAREQIAFSRSRSASPARIQRHGGLGRIDLGQPGDPRRHGQHVVVECAGMGQRIGPARIEPVHDVRPAAERAERHAAADVFAERRQVGLHAAHRLQAARRQPRGHDLVQDQQRAAGRSSRRAAPGETPARPQCIRRRPSSAPG